MPRYLVVLDFEATCERNSPIHEIIEFPSVVVDTTTQQVVDRFECFVKPMRDPQVSAFCHKLTTITQVQVDSGISLQEALKRHQTFLAPYQSDSILVTCGDWDLKTMLPSDVRLNNLQIPNYYRRWINIKQHFTALYGKRCREMEGMLEYLQLSLKGTHHRGIDDCVNIGAIAIRMLQDGWQP